jgi:hypothetical protein
MLETADVEKTSVGWRSLLLRAAAVYDEPGSPLPSAARSATWGGFASGAEWMRLAMERLRGAPVGPPAPEVNFQSLGVLKYAVASVAAMTAVAAACFTTWPVAVLAVPLFYAAEAQAVFLFPVALDGSPHPFRDARRWTVRAGGTLRAMAVVMPVAATMLLGGFVGRGFRRSWCLGCLAVCVWYEDVRSARLAAAA